MGEYCSLAALKRELGITENKDDDILEAALRDAERYIENETHRKFRVTEVSWRVFNPLKDVTDDGVLLLDTDLVKDDQIINGDGAVIPVASRALLTPNEPPYWGIALAPGYWWTFDDNPWGAIRIRGWWGYSLKAPDDIVKCTKIIAGYLYRQKDAQVMETASFVAAGVLTIPGGVPRTAEAILDNYRRGGTR